MHLFVPRGLYRTAERRRVNGMPQHPARKRRAKARRILLARVHEQCHELQRAKLSAQRRSMVGSGDRGDRIRTYNYPQNRITDHRIGVDVFDVPGTLAGGNLDEFHKALSERDSKLRLKSL